MRIEHQLPSALLGRRPVRILVVGAGGSGSAVVLGLPYLDQAMRAWGHSYGLDVTLMDADTVSDTNCIRQPFSVSDIGQNKATVLINRINLFWGTNWSAVPNHFHSRSFDRNQDRCPDLLIGCVDTRAGRKAIEESFKRALSSTCYFLDLGNNAASGQFVLGQPLNARNRRKADRLRTVSELYPEIIDTTQEKIHCPAVRQSKRWTGRNHSSTRRSHQARSPCWRSSSVMASSHITALSSTRRRDR